MRATQVAEPIQPAKTTPSAFGAKVTVTSVPASYVPSSFCGAGESVTDANSERHSPISSMAPDGVSPSDTIQVRFSPSATATESPVGSGASSP